MILEKALKILAQPVCDNCLGRQFGQLLQGYTNRERGALVRTIAAMQIDRSKEEKKDESMAKNRAEFGAYNEGKEPSQHLNTLDMSNFSGFRFHNLEAEKTERKACSVCNGFFDSAEKWVKKIERSCKKYSIRTFLVGTKLSFELVENEEALWERVGIDYCEPIKAEINREIGKIVEKRLKIRFDQRRPDANIILSLADSSVDVQLNPLFIYGKYQKLKRGIPQTRWPSGKYKTSVEQIVAKPFMKFTGAKAHKLHGCGREDIDARCLGWRPFVLELIEPRRRDIDMEKLAKKIEKSVKVKGMRLSDIAEVRKIKETKVDKTYRALVECSRKTGKKELENLKQLKTIMQKTPKRVMHRRADRMRKRTVR